jgi:hypothetical protein
MKKIDVARLANKNVHGVDAGAAAKPNGGNAAGASARHSFKTNGSTRPKTDCGGACGCAGCGPAKVVASTAPKQVLAGYAAQQFAGPYAAFGPYARGNPKGASITQRIGIAKYPTAPSIGLAPTGSFGQNGLPTPESPVPARFGVGIPHYFDRECRDVTFPGLPAIPPTPGTPDSIRSASCRCVPKEWTYLDEYGVERRVEPICPGRPDNRCPREPVPYVGADGFIRTCDYGPDEPRYCCPPPDSLWVLQRRHRTDRPGDPMVSVSMFFGPVCWPVPPSLAEIPWWYAMLPDFRDYEYGPPLPLGDLWSPEDVLVPGTPGTPGQPEVPPRTITICGFRFGDTPGPRFFRGPIPGPRRRF